jgi:signal transduction histidine kinase
MVIVHDPGAFSQIITSLLLNTACHGYAPGECAAIRVAFSTTEYEYILTYQDFGRGISAQHRERIFEPFYTTNRREHAGLGLHIVYNVVRQALQGEIECSSGEPAGTVFTIRFPRHVGGVPTS